MVSVTYEVTEGYQKENKGLLQKDNLKAYYGSDI